MRAPARIRLIIFSLLLSAVFLFLALRNVSLAQAWQTLRTPDAKLFVFPMAISLGNFALRSWRWRYFFPSGSSPRFWPSFRALAISFMGNNLLPGRAGDLARCLITYGRVDVSRSTVALAALAVEKLFDGLALLCVVLYSCWQLSPPVWLSRLGIAGAVVFGGAAAIFLMLRWRTDWLFERLEIISSKIGPHRSVERSLAMLRSFAAGIHALNSTRVVLLVCAQTTAIWGSEALMFWTLARVLHISLPLSGAVVASAVLGLGLMIPAAPGALGSYEFFSTAALRLVGVAAAPALALTLLLHGWVLVFNTAAGFASMSIAGLSLKQLSVSELEGNTGETCPVVAPQPDALREL